MQLQSRFALRAPQVVHETFDDEVILLDLDSGSYYSLGGSGVDILQCVEQGATLGEMTACIVSRYQGASWDIEASVQAFIAELLDEALIISSSADLPQQQALHTAVDAAAERPAFSAPRLEKYTDMQELLLLDPVHDVDETGWPNAQAAPPGSAV